MFPPLLLGLYCYSFADIGLKELGLGCSPPAHTLLPGLVPSITGSRVFPNIFLGRGTVTETNKLQHPMNELAILCLTVDIIFHCQYLSRGLLPNKDEL
jgi:hypothetical protein